MFVVEFFDGFGEGDFEWEEDWEGEKFLLDGVDGFCNAVVVGFMVKVVDVVDVCVAFFVDGVEFAE